MAIEIAKGLREACANVDFVDIFEISEPAEMLEFEKYNGILIGTYTWMGGDVPDEFLDFYEDLPLWDLSKQKAAVFGSYDSLYGNDGAAVDLFVDALEEAGAKILLTPFKIELEPDSNEIKKCRSYGKKFADRLKDILSTF